MSVAVDDAFGGSGGGWALNSSSDTALSVLSLPVLCRSPAAAFWPSRENNFGFIGLHDSDGVSSSWISCRASSNSLENSPSFDEDLDVPVSVSVESELFSTVVVVGLLLLLLGFGLSPTAEATL